MILLPYIKRFKKKKEVLTATQTFRYVKLNNDFCFKKFHHFPLSKPFNKRNLKGKFTIVRYTG
jgi:hypothetical protein